MNTPYNPYAINELDIAKTVCDSFTYLVKNNSGLLEWHCSQHAPFLNQVLGLLEDEKLAKRLTPSDDLGFVFERGLAGTKLRKVTQTGHAFASWIRLPTLTQPPPGYQQGEILNLIRQQAKLHLGKITFSGNPLAMVNPTGTLEGELVNTFLVRTREALLRPSTRKLHEASKDQLRNDTRKVLRSIDRCQTVIQFPGIAELRLHYFGREKHFTQEESTAHIDLFAERLMTSQSGIAPPIWLHWKPLYTEEQGYGYHLLVVYDMQHVNVHSALYGLVGLWHELTDQYGVAMVTNHLGSDFRLLKRLVSLLFRCDALLRLKGQPNKPNFGICFNSRVNTMQLPIVSEVTPC
uniref:Uncharacterized protein n=1 Tax=Dechloromonas aromatica (strain RCB) TaxID=159087 RepID=Q47FJ1_DECAR